MKEKILAYIQQLGSDSDKVRKKAREELMKIGILVVENRNFDVLKFLITQLRKRYEDVHISSVTKLIKKALFNYIFNSYVKFLGDRNKRRERRTYREAISYLGVYAFRNLFEIIRTANIDSPLEDHTRSGEARRLLYYYFYRGNNRAIRAALRAIKSRDPILRKWGALFLSKLKQPRPDIFEALIFALKGEDRLSLQWVGIAIYNMFFKLKAMLASNDISVRRKSARILMEYAEIIGRLFEVAVPINYYRFISAIDRGIRSIKNELLKLLKDADEEVKDLIRAFLKRIISILLNEMRPGKPDRVRISAINALGNLGFKTKEIEDALNNACEERNARIKKATNRAMKKLKLGVG